MVDTVPLIAGIAGGVVLLCLFCLCCSCGLYGIKRMNQSNKKENKKSKSTKNSKPAKKSNKSKGGKKKHCFCHGTWPNPEPASDAIAAFYAKSPTRVHAPQSNRLLGSTSATPIFA
mmetsp:Transcript_19848/g.39919  ORF Transcript_19848/g.39919 Transcript_19848/m.39919 type:complete len:116 (+) Transcript_19848:77-424(+)